MNKPIAYCVDLEDDAMIEASKILGLEPTDVKFLNTPLYTHPMRELTDEKIIKIANKKITDDFYIPEHLDYLLIRFARAIIKASRGEK